MSSFAFGMQNLNELHSSRPAEACDTTPAHTCFMAALGAAKQAYRRLDWVQKAQRRYWIIAVTGFKTLLQLESSTAQHEGVLAVNFNFFGDAEQNVARAYFKSWRYRWQILKLELCGWHVNQWYRDYADDDESLGEGFMELRLWRSHLWFLGPLRPWHRRGFWWLLEKIGSGGMTLLTILGLGGIILAIMVWLS